MVQAQTRVADQYQPSVAMMSHYLLPYVVCLHTLSVMTSYSEALRNTHVMYVNLIYE